MAMSFGEGHDALTDIRLQQAIRLAFRKKLHARCLRREEAPSLSTRSAPAGTAPRKQHVTTVCTLCHTWGAWRVSLQVGKGRQLGRLYRTEGRCRFSACAPCSFSPPRLPRVRCDGLSSVHVHLTKLSSLQVRQSISLSPTTATVPPPQQSHHRNSPTTATVPPLQQSHHCNSPTTATVPPLQQSHHCNSPGRAP